jgi:flagellar motility protein MotE (MotC chaperone)
MPIRLFPIVLTVLIIFMAVKLSSVLQQSIEYMVVNESIAAEDASKSGAAAGGDADPSKPSKSDAVSFSELLNPPTKSNVSDVKPEQDDVITNLSKPSDHDKERQIRAMSDTEVEILQNLVKRRQELDARDKDISLRENSLQAIQQNIQGKITELNTLQDKIQTILNEYNSKEDEKLAGIVKVYEAMKPADAAKIFEQMDMNILLDVANLMKDAKLAAILSKMDPYKAKELTVELANRRKLESK